MRIVCLVSNASSNQLVRLYPSRRSWRETTRSSSRASARPRESLLRTVRSSSTAGCAMNPSQGCLDNRGVGGPDRNRPGLCIQATWHEPLAGASRAAAKEDLALARHRGLGTRLVLRPRSDGPAEASAPPPGSELLLLDRRQPAAGPAGRPQVRRQSLMQQFGGISSAMARTRTSSIRTDGRERTRSRSQLPEAEYVVFTGTPMANKGLDRGLRRARCHPRTETRHRDAMLLSTATVVALPQRVTRETTGQLPEKIFEAMAMARRPVRCSRPRYRIFRRFSTAVASSSHQATAVHLPRGSVKSLTTKSAHRVGVRGATKGRGGVQL